MTVRAFTQSRPWKHPLERGVVFALELLMGVIL
jgi:hypothetical protein